MTDSPDDAHATAVDELEALGLSTYAARTFVALTVLEEGTAEDVSEVVDVPRTRVYDAVDELQDRGLVDVRGSNPKRFWAISAETTRRYFQREYADRVDLLADALADVSPSRRAPEQSGVWTETGSGAVAERVADLVSAAAEDVVYVGGAVPPDDAVADALRAAGDRGDAVRLAVGAGDRDASLEDAVPDAGVFESHCDWTGTPAGRLLLVDGDAALVSVLGRDGGADDETAVWATGEANSLVVVLDRLVSWQLPD